MKQKDTAPGGEIGRQATLPDHAFVQVPRKAMEAWAQLLARKPTAGRLLMWMTSRMGELNALVVSQKTLARVLGVSDRTIKTAVSDLTKERWIQVTKLNGPGTVNAYIVNSRVAWAQRRDDMRLSRFNAVVVADQEDQEPATLDDTPLRQIPVLFPGEKQIPVGDGLPPPSEPALPGMEADMPAIQQDFDPETGEILDIEYMIAQSTQKLRVSD